MSKSRQFKRKSHIVRKFIPINVRAVKVVVWCGDEAIREYWRRRREEYLNRLKVGD